MDLYDDDNQTFKSIVKCIRKSKENGIEPKRQYLKTLTDDQYNKIIGKDAYAFLHGHEEELIATLAVGKEVSDDFKTLSAIDVREVYRIIITEIERTNWSSKKMVEQLMDKFPLLEEYQAERIIRTELTRIINYAKEFVALRDDDGLMYNYVWIGPLDMYTTPMCWYLQTGKLRDKDLKILEKKGHTVADLPKIPEEGLPLEDLRMACRQVAEAFGYDMISDWVMHINCRHTFARSNKILNDREIEESDLYRWIEQFSSLTPGGGEEPMVELTPSVEEDKAYFVVYDDLDSFVFINSIYRVPTMYDNLMTDEIFVFEEMNEKDVASWARMVIQLREEKVSDDIIIWAMQDMGNIEDDVITYIVVNAEKIMRRAENEGWFE